MLPAAVARSFSGGVAVCYGLPVLWMTSSSHTVARHRRCEGYMLKATHQRQGSKSDAYDYLVIFVNYLYSCSQPLVH